MCARAARETVFGSACLWAQRGTVIKPELEWLLGRGVGPLTRPDQFRKSLLVVLVVLIWAGVEFKARSDMKPFILPGAYSAKAVNSSVSMHKIAPVRRCVHRCARRS